MAEEKIINGIDVKQLAETIHVVRREPDSGKCSFRARNRWGGGSYCASTIQDFSLGGHEDKSRTTPFVLEGGEPNAASSKIMRSVE